MDRLVFLEKLAKSYNSSIDCIKPTTTFVDLGMDSYEVVDFIVAVEEEYTIVIDDSRILELKSMQDVLDMIDQCKQEESIC